MKLFFKDFVKELEEGGYYVSYEVVDSSEYGVPTKKKKDFYYWHQN